MRRRAIGALLILAAPFVLYALNPLTPGGSAFYRSYVHSCQIALVALLLALAARRWLGQSALVALSAAALGVLLWRHGQYVHTAVDPYVFNPQVRAPLDVPSPAVQEIARREKQPVRIAGLGMNLYCGAAQNFLQEGIYGVDAVRSPFYDRLAVAAGIPKVLYWGTDNFGGERDRARGAFDLLNVKFYLDRPGATPEPSGLTRIAQRDLTVYESPTAWPRAFFTNRIVLADTVEDVVRRLGPAAGQPFVAVDRDERDSLPPLEALMRSSPTPAAVPARDYRLSTNRTSFTVEAPGPGVVALTEAYYPKDFRVSLNGTVVPYFRVNYAFKGVWVPAAGTYTVSFQYWPHHLTLSLWIALGGTLGAIGLLIFSFRPENQGGQRAAKTA